jgi:hypothetical protein
VHTNISSREQVAGNNVLSSLDRRNRYAGIFAPLGLILYSFFVDPEKVTFFPCYFREWTGWNCFACGLSHSLHAAATLNWTTAITYHLFGPILFLTAWAILLYWSLELALGRKGILPVRREKIKTGIIVAAVAWLIYWLFHLSPGT